MEKSVLVGSGFVLVHDPDTIALIVRRIIQAGASGFAEDLCFGRLH
jgi:hypothetical protein